MMTSPRRGRVRPFAESDIPRVAHLHRTVFRTESAPSEEAYREFFSELYLSDPETEEGGASLVYEEDDGNISGFIGAAPLAMSLGERAVRARISSAFIVDPQRRGWAGLSLLRAFLNGPQDLSIADEANSDSRIVWQALGGATAMLFSMRWIYPLRPFRLGLSLLLQQRPRLANALAAAAAPVTSALDRLAACSRAASPEPPVRLMEEELTPAALEAALKQPVKRPLLRPAHDLRSLQWRLDRAARLDRGRLQKRLLKAENDAVAGWFVYHLKPGGLCEVVQLHAFPPHERAVLGHLAEHAFRGGAAGLQGRFEPCVSEALARRRYVFRYGPPWTLIHARDRELLDAFHRGEAFFSRLDGELCLRLD
jgi:hypothetical protein